MTQVYEETWNKDADEYNQWDTLDCDEKLSFVIAEQVKMLEVIRHKTRILRKDILNAIGFYVPTTISAEIRDKFIKEIKIITRTIDKVKGTTQ